MKIGCTVSELWRENMAMAILPPPPPPPVQIGSIPITTDRHHLLRLQLHGAIYRPNSFVLMLRYYANLKVIRYESTSFNRIVADKSHRVIVA